MKDFIGDSLKAVSDMFLEAYTKKWFWYALAAMALLIVLLFYNKGALKPSGL